MSKGILAAVFGPSLRTRVDTETSATIRRLRRARERLGDHPDALDHAMGSLDRPAGEQAKDARKREDDGS